MSQLEGDCPNCRWSSITSEDRPYRQRNPMSHYGVSTYLCRPTGRAFFVGAAIAASLSLGLCAISRAEPAPAASGAKAPTTAPSPAEPAFHEGERFARAGNLEASEAALREAIKADPNYAPA